MSCIGIPSRLHFRHHFSLCSRLHFGIYFRRHLELTWNSLWTSLQTSLWISLRTSLWTLASRKLGILSYDRAPSFPAMPHFSQIYFSNPFAQKPFTPTTTHTSSKNPCSTTHRPQTPRRHSINHLQGLTTKGGAYTSEAISYQKTHGYKFGSNHGHPTGAKRRNGAWR